MKILIPIDSSDASDAAVCQVVGQVKTGGTEVALLHIVDPFPDKLARKKGHQDSPDFAGARRELQASAAKLIARASERLQAAGFRVRSSIQEGDVRSLILEEARTWGADLIVLGAHLRSGTRHFFVSSISQYVSREAACSVEIVRIQGRAEDVPPADFATGSRGCSAVERSLYFACRKAGD